ncbi:hypothetical protein ABK040_013315 [Willaertia magna]
MSTTINISQQQHQQQQQKQHLLTGTLTLGSLSQEIPISPIPTTLIDNYNNNNEINNNINNYNNNYNNNNYNKENNIKKGFLYFNLNNMPEFVEEGAKLINDRIKNQLKLKNPFIISPETSTIAMIHVLRTKYNIPCLLLSKKKRPTCLSTLYNQSQQSQSRNLQCDEHTINNSEESELIICEEYHAITSNTTNKLYFECCNNINLQNFDIIIVDNVCTTASTLIAIYKLLIRAGYKENIIETIVLFTEGEERREIKVFGCDKDYNNYCNEKNNEVLLLGTFKIYSFGHLPFYDL